MANICYSAVLVRDRETFKSVLDFVETNKRFIDYCDNHCVDFMGVQKIWDNIYVFRFETKWRPDFYVPREISKKVGGEIEFWYQETGVGFAGMYVYDSGKRKSEKYIPCDICDPDMRKCLYYTDLEGINWTQSITDDIDANIIGGLRYPHILKVVVKKYVDDSYLPIILEQNYCGGFGAADIADHIKSIKEKYAA